MHGGDTTSRIELWGGIECTRNRVGDVYHDQLAWTGHDRRAEDLDRIAELGIRTLRYPVLWEHAATGAPDSFDWTWADGRLPRLKALGIRPIAGLVHHGSGPRHTDLLSPTFAPGLAEYARAVAERFPWLDAYTPVNEPLTTARFSALYGHWYPHARDPRAFARAMLNQCRGVILAMEAIRKVRPDAQLVQTEDISKVYGARRLAYQVRFENHRRFLTFDLLAGRVDRHHPLGAYFLWLGIEEDELRWFADRACQADLIGMNYYLTSERFLDDRIERYPPGTAGSNGRHQYVDVEAVRVREAGVAGPRELLGELWRRYRRPIAITEAHLGCTREEQLRWLWEVWQAGEKARAAGVDVRAVTCWSLLGAYDWDSLVTKPRGFYEPGAFDVRNGNPRPTAIARLAQQLASGERPTSPVLLSPGWWRRPERLLAPLACSGRTGPCLQAGPPLLVTGATGTLGQAIARTCATRGIVCRLLTRAEMDIADPPSVEAALALYEPWAVVNAAGYVRVDQAESEPLKCLRENLRGPVVLARACARAGIPLATFSSDLVFDGTGRTPYSESDTVAPLSVYGQSKARADRRVVRLHPKALVVRTSAFFGPWDEFNFVTLALRALKADGRFAAPGDHVVSPTYVPDLAGACLDLLVDGAAGVWHLANQGQTSWVDLAREAATRAGLDPRGVKAAPLRTFGWVAERPAYSVLGSERGLLLPSLDDALARYFRDRPPQSETSCRAAAC